MQHEILVDRHVFNNLEQRRIDTITVLQEPRLNDSYSIKTPSGQSGHQALSMNVKGVEIIPDGYRVKLTFVSNSSAIPN